MKGKARTRGAPMLCALTLGFTIACPAFADELPAAKSLTIEVQGKIEQHCSMGSIPNLVLGDLTTVRGERRQHVAMDCNVPVEIKVKSGNGGLTNLAYPNGQGPYKGRLGYRLSLSVPVRKPELQVVTGSFKSEDMIAGRTVSSGDGIPLDGMELSIEFDQLRGDDALLGGDYSEIVEITVTPI